MLTCMIRGAESTFFIRIHDAVIRQLDIPTFY